MPHYRATFGFSNWLFGPSESYISKNFSTRGAFSTALQRLVDRRNDILPGNIQWAGIRISQVSEPTINVRRRSKLFPPGSYTEAQAGYTLFVPPNGTYGLGTGNTAPDQARACLQISMRYNEDRFSIRYLSYVPDNILHNEPASVDFALNGAWLTAFNVFVGELTGENWQIQARKTGGVFDPQPISEWVQADAVGSNLGIAIPSGTALPSGKGDKIHVKNVVRKGTDKLSYNGKYIVKDVNTTLVPGYVVYYLDGTGTGNAKSIKLPGNVAPVALDFYNIQGVSPLRAGVHKRGKSFASPRGRRKTRISLDP